LVFRPPSHRPLSRAGLPAHHAHVATSVLRFPRERRGRRAPEC
jgi:hypothetical protein